MVAPCCLAMERRGRLDADLVADEERDAELDEDNGDELEVDEEEISACAPYLARQMSCLGRRTPGIKDTPILGLARGAKEAVDLLTQSEFVSGERVRNRGQTHSDLPRFKPPEG